MRGVKTMGKAILAVVVTLIVGVICTSIGHGYMGGFGELGTIAAVVTMGGFVVYFNEKKK
jgi:hypothetical protein